MANTFQTGVPESYLLYTGVYLWSNTANWVGGAKPANGGVAAFNISSSYGNPTGVDDIANLYLDSLSMPQGYVAVVGALEIGKLTLGAGSGEIFASTIAGNSSAALKIDGLAGSAGMYIGADGAGAVTTIAATADPGEYYEANEGGEVVFNPAPSAASYLVYGNAPGGYVTTFAFQNPGATVAANLSAVAIGDAIALPGGDVSSVTFVDSTGFGYNGTLTVVTNLGTTTFNHVYYNNNVTPTGYTVSTDAATGLERITFYCFMAGTLIRTPDGEVPVEKLRRGDLVITSEGLAKPVSWLGKQTVSTVFADPVRSWPVRVKAGALSENVPSRDLLLSPDHALLVDDVLIQAGALVNGTSILRESVVPSIFVYHHVELDDHSLILAENTPAETFVDNVDRMGFDNWAEHEAIFPEGKPIEEMPYPRAKARRQVPMHIRAALDARANLIGAGAVAAVAC